MVDGTQGLGLAIGADGGHAVTRCCLGPAQQLLERTVGDLGQVNGVVGHF